MTARYAVFFAPDSDTHLWHFGTRWLGRDPVSGTDLAQPRLPGLAPERIRQVTDFPRHYGFHATLKAPFALRPDRSVDELQAGLSDFARQFSTFEIGPPRLAAIGDFLAFLLPDGPVPKFQDLADASVRAFDVFRAPPSPHELARRRAANLTERQEELLVRWGYPYVFDQYRFHMTLTCRLDQTERAQFEAQLADASREACAEPIRVGDVSLFAQPHRESPFRLIARHAFSG